MLSCRNKHRTRLEESETSVFLSDFFASRSLRFISASGASYGTLPLSPPM